MDFILVVQLDVSASLELAFLKLFLVYACYKKAKFAILSFVNIMFGLGLSN